jgi:methylenetetrahydrofolate reductase (NADPH)
MKIEHTLQLASYIQQTLGIGALPHLPARFMTKKQVQQALTLLQEQAVFQLLAVSGEVTAPGDMPMGEFQFANELSYYINEQTTQFTVMGTCHPEHIKNQETARIELEYIQRKVQNGCQQFLTQLFFENDGFYRLHEVYGHYLNLPLLVGVLPILSYAQVLNMATRNHLAIPRKLAIILEKYQYNPLSMRAAGIDYTLQQIDELLTHGVEGIHLFTMNDIDATQEIHRSFW